MFTCNIGTDSGCRDGLGVYRIRSESASASTPVFGGPWPPPDARREARQWFVMGPHTDLQAGCFKKTALFFYS
jgi:hypothetical protein